MFTERKQDLIIKVFNSQIEKYKDRLKLKDTSRVRVFYHPNFSPDLRTIYVFLINHEGKAVRERVCLIHKDSWPIYKLISWFRTRYIQSFLNLEKRDVHRKETQR